MADIVSFVFTFERGILIKCLLALVLGIILGYEREKRNKQIGMRTISLVVMTAMIFSYISLDPVFAIQPAFIASQVVFGVTFLGAGLILKTSDGKIDNITTATTIWFAASLGMLTGVGLYMVSLITTVFYFVIISLPNIYNDKK